MLLSIFTLVCSNSDSLTKAWWWWWLWDTGDSTDCAKLKNPFVCNLKPRWRVEIKMGPVGRGPSKQWIAFIHEQHNASGRRLTPPPDQDTKVQRSRLCDQKKLRGTFQIGGDFFQIVVHTLQIGASHTFQPPSFMLRIPKTTQCMYVQSGGGKEICTKICFLLSQKLDIATVLVLAFFRLQTRHF